MEESHLTSFEVQGFKKFKELKVTDIGQFNLIVGDNNSGKTTLLEALLADKDTQKTLEYLSDILYQVKKFTNLSDYFLSYYFSNNQEKYPYNILFALTKKAGPFETIKYTRSTEISFHQHYLENAYPGKGDIGPQIQPRADQNKSFNFDSPFIPFGPLYNHELTRIYGKYIQLFVDKQEKLIESLSHIIPNINKIEVSAVYSHNPILLISEKNKNRLSPLATYGDGTLKLFRILLSLFSSDHYSRIMIDEIDTGVHYSRMKDFLKSLLSVAKEEGKQIFATTHTKECIENFKEALKETGFENKGRIIRLAETKSGIRAYTMQFPEFENALLAESEIR